MTAPAKVAIGMPVYNGDKYLRAALDSLLAQTFTDFQLLIFDNASTDQTQAICREYGARDSRIHYFRNASNIGAAPNMNRVFQCASAEYFKWAAHDDLLAPRYLEQCTEVLDQEPSVVLCHSKTRHIDSNGRDISLATQADDLVIDSEGHTLRLPPSDLARRLNSPRAHQRYADVLWKPLACLDIFGLIRTDVLSSVPSLCSYFGSDRVLVAELALRGRFHHVPEPLFLWRNHIDQASLLDARSRQLWHGGPDSHIRPSFEFSRGFLGSLSRVSLPLTERTLCYVTLCNYYARPLAKRCARSIRLRRPVQRPRASARNTSANPHQAEVRD